MGIICKEQEAFPEMIIYLMDGEGKLFQSWVIEDPINLTYDFENAI